MYEWVVLVTCTAYAPWAIKEKQLKFREICACSFWATITSNGSPYATGPLSRLSVTLVYCGLTVGWIKMPLAAEVGLVPGDIVLNEDPASPTESGTAALSVVAKRSPISATAELVLKYASGPTDRQAH